MPSYSTRYFELTYSDKPKRYLTLIGSSDLEKAIATGHHHQGLQTVREVSADEIPAPVPTVPEPAAAPMNYDVSAIVEHLTRQNQILAAALDELAGKHNALKDYAEAIARHAILPPELKKGAA